VKQIDQIANKQASKDNQSKGKQLIVTV